MELIVHDPTYSGEGGDNAKFIEELKKELTIVSNDFQIKEIDIGRGANWPVVLITFSGIFLLGKKINENLEAWISLGKKLTKLLENIKRKFGQYRIDAEGASLMAMERIFFLTKGAVSSIEKISENVVLVSPLARKDSRGLSAKPDALYLQIYKVNRDEYYIFGIKSKGTIEIEYKIDSENWLGF
jgi:hypothetical protein